MGKITKKPKKRDRSQYYKEKARIMRESRWTKTMSTTNTQHCSTSSEIPLSEPPQEQEGVESALQILDLDNQSVICAASQDDERTKNSSKKRLRVQQTNKSSTGSSVPSQELSVKSSQPQDASVSNINVDNEVRMSGHRILEINHFFSELKKISNHKSLFQCGLNTIDIISEKCTGLKSEFLLSCSMCNEQFKITSSLQNVNKNAVTGVMVAGCGHAQLKQISASLDLPIISDGTYKHAHDEICDDWESTAWDEMRKAGEKERAAAIAEGNIDKNGNAMIDVILDGCWCKRSYKTNYSALSGAATIIGRRFGQVLFMSVKNKYCCICARAEKKKETIREHECFKNFSGPSTAMESSIIVEGFKQSIEMHGLIYSRFIADGDSSTYSKILETRPYSDVTVEKINCKNHILRNFCNKLQSLKVDTKYKPAERKLVTNEKVLSSRRYICKAIECWGNASENKSQKIQNLHKDISVSIHHAFENHSMCNKNICDKNTKKDHESFFNSSLWQRIRFITASVANHARSLIENVDSNVVERLNGVIAKFVGGKRVNYALRRSYQARCAGAVISFNTGKLLSTVHKKVYNKSPSARCKQFEEKTARKREYNKTLKRKKNRNLISKKIDLNYGENADRPDMDPERYELAKVAFLENLEMTAKQRVEIEKRTILQSDCGEWLELRRNLLTASNFGKVYKRRVGNSCASMVKNMLYKANIDHVASIEHGKKNEKIALEQLAKLLGVEIKPCGLFIDPMHPFLGATPDGVVDDKTLVEIKCPIAPSKIGIDAAIQQGKMHFWRVNKKSGQIYVNKNSDWFIQIQGQLQICQKSKCIIGVWYGMDQIKVETIERDKEFWTNVKPKLIQFYMDCLLPELVDPRFTRNKPIREPEYCKSKEKNTQKESKTDQTLELQQITEDVGRDNVTSSEFEIDFSVF